MREDVNVTLPRKTLQVQVIPRLPSKYLYKKRQHHDVYLFHKVVISLNFELHERCTVGGA